MLIFLKLGGSLITDKTRPYTARTDKIDLLADEISSALQEQPDLQLVIGHGSGSFGHQAAKKHKTRDGVADKEGWKGFTEVWYQASKLNRMVVEALIRARIPVITISPFSSFISRNRMVIEWNPYHATKALEHGLVPVVHGDVCFDEMFGGTILSTEEIFVHMGKILKPNRILIAGLEEGVWQDYPNRDTLLGEITPETFSQSRDSLRPGMGVDTTGGMQSKVTAMLSLVKSVPDMDVLIFSGDTYGNVKSALNGGSPGTRIHV